MKKFMDNSWSFVLRRRQLVACFVFVKRTTTNNPNENEKKDFELKAT